MFFTCVTQEKWKLANLKITSHLLVDICPPVYEWNSRFLSGTAKTQLLHAALAVIVQNVIASGEVTNVTLSLACRIEHWLRIIVGRMSHIQAGLFSLQKQAFEKTSWMQVNIFQIRLNAAISVSKIKI